MFFFFNDTATTEIYTLSLHDALPILHAELREQLRLAVAVFMLGDAGAARRLVRGKEGLRQADRKSTRLNSSHANISYAVFCLKKNKHYADSISFVLTPFFAPHLCA